MTAPLWTPSPARVQASNIAAFLKAVEGEWGVSLSDSRALYRWSVEEPRKFWPSVWKFAGIVASHAWDEVLVDGDKMPGAKWFTGAELNFAENLLRRRDEAPALIFWGETGARRRTSFAALRGQVARLARSLKAEGVGTGDRVVGYMPNVPETVVAMLAATSLGAMWSSCSPDFGVKGVLDRFGRIEPKVLFTADGYVYAGKEIDSLERVRGILREIPEVGRVVVVPSVHEKPDLSGLTNAVMFDDYLSADGGELDFAQLPFDHPVLILYSSGTTGTPKCIVHGAGGTLIQHQKEHLFHTDLRPGDRLFYFTTCGWMMWNWLVSALASGVTVLLYDGSPFHPDGNVLFDMAEREEMTVFGTSAKYIAAVEKAGLKPARTHDLSRLKAMLSTGSPLPPEGFEFVYRDIKEDIVLSSISGGTDLISCFALGDPTAPVYRGELQTRGFGMAVEIFDDGGRPLRGEKGELVCTAPFPSMPVAFWNDPTGEKYRAAYFERYPGAWHHGDYAELTEHDGLIIYGRSDAVLNPGGVRIGTAEIYRQVEQLDEVLESIAAGQEWENDVRVILFVKLKPGVDLDDELSARIKRQIRENTTPRHVPAKVVQVRDIPRTISGKIVELAVGHVIHGRTVKNVDALANPEALEFFKDLPELRT